VAGGLLERQRFQQHPFFSPNLPFIALQYISYTALIHYNIGKI